MEKMAKNLQKPTAELDKDWNTITYIENKNNIFQPPIVVKGELPKIFIKKEV